MIISIKPINSQCPNVNSCLKLTQANYHNFMLQFQIYEVIAQEFNLTHFISVWLQVLGELDNTSDKLSSN